MVAPKTYCKVYRYHKSIPWYDQLAAIVDREVISSILRRKSARTMFEWIYTTKWSASIMLEIIA